MAARTAVVAGTATAVSGAVAQHQHERAMQRHQPPAAAPAPSPVAAPQDAMLSQVQQLAVLNSQGVLGDAEFAAAVRRLLGL